MVPITVLCVCAHARAYMRACNHLFFKDIYVSYFLACLLKEITLQSFDDVYRRIEIRSR